MLYCRKCGDELYEESEDMLELVSENPLADLLFGCPTCEWLFAYHIDENGEDFHEVEDFSI